MATSFHSSTDALLNRYGILLSYIHLVSSLPQSLPSPLLISRYTMSQTTQTDTAGTNDSGELYNYPRYASR